MLNCKQAGRLQSGRLQSGRLLWATDFGSGMQSMYCNLCTAICVGKLGGYSLGGYSEPPILGPNNHSPPLRTYIGPFNVAVVQGKLQIANMQKCNKYNKCKSANLQHVKLQKLQICKYANLQQLQICKIATNAKQQTVKLT